MAGFINNIGLAEPTGTSSNNVSNQNKNNGDMSFADFLKNTVDETNKIQSQGERALSDLATGQVKDLHQAALSINKAETSMKLMLEVRNKALSAYKELSRTQI
jgi:flagellar hook-basal body complex protein FliE